MLGPVLDTAIGLVFLFTILSAITSGIVEFVSRYLKLRSRTLLKGIQSLLGEMASDFWTQPLVEPSKTPSGRLPKREDVASRGGGESTVNSTEGAETPSYIAPTIFSRSVAVMLLPNADATTSGMQRSSVLARGWPRYLRQLAADDDEVSVDPGKRALAAKLLPLAEAARGDHERFLKELETWFDDTMDRVSGWYKRTLKIWLFAIGFVVAVGVNADAVHVANYLWNDEIARTAVADAAAEFVGQAVEEPTARDAATIQAEIDTLVAERTALKEDHKEAKETRAGTPPGSPRRDRATKEVAALAASIATTTGDIAAAQEELDALSGAPAVAPCEITGAVVAPSDAPTDDETVTEEASGSGLDSGFCCSDPDVDPPLGPDSGQERLDGCLQALKDLETLGIPLGWPIHPWDWADPRVPNDLGELIIKLLGFIVTAYALSFGAAFWFDLLGKLVNLRNAGKKPTVETSES